LKKKALVIGGTHNDAVPMAVFVINIKKTNAHLVDEIVIFHDGIPQKTQNLMNSIFPCRFELYQFPGYKPGDFNNYVNKYFTPMVFCRYECLRLLNEYSVVMWSDYDVVILKDISELLEPCVSGMKLVLPENPDSSVYNTFLPTIKDVQYVAEYDLEKRSLSSAIIVLFDFLKDSMAMYEWCIKTTKKLGKHLWLTELSIYNLLLQEFKVDASLIPSSIYCPHPIHDNTDDNTKILHAYGQPKFWNGMKNETWEKNYKAWTKFGGMRLPKKRLFPQLLKKLKQFVKKMIEISDIYKYRGGVEQVELSIFCQNWRKNNTHNETVPINIFNDRNVIVGEKTYGCLNVIDYSYSTKLIIGSYCSIAENVVFLLGAEHPLDTISTYPFKVMNFGEKRKGLSKGDIIIGDDVWIGMNAVIHSGVRINQGAVVGASAVVTHDVPPYAIVGGNPAKIVRYRFGQELRERLVKIDLCRLFDSFTREDIPLVYSPLTDDLLDKIL
jgi:acetyltransferase-like isoleucine patch superfamily enzyme